MAESAIRRSPIHPPDEPAAVSFSNFAGWQLPTDYGDPVAETATARKGIALADDSGCGKIHVQGRAGGEVVAVLGIDVPERIGTGAPASGLAVYRLRADQLFILTPPGAEHGVIAELAAANTGPELVTVSDVTDGRAQLRLIGPRSAELLSRLCSLDFDPSRFPNRTAKQSSIAKTTQLIIRDDLPGDLLGWRLIGARSLAAYLWTILLEAGHDLSIRPIGQRALAILVGES